MKDPKSLAQAIRRKKAFGGLIEPEVEMMHNSELPHEHIVSEIRKSLARKVSPDGLREDKYSTGGPARPGSYDPSEDNLEDDMRPSTDKNDMLADEDAYYSEGGLNVKGQMPLINENDFLSNPYSEKEAYGESPEERSKKRLSNVMRKRR